MFKKVLVASQEHFKTTVIICGVSEATEAYVTRFFHLTLCSESFLLRFPNQEKEVEKQLESADVFCVKHRKYNALQETKQKNHV